MANYPRKSLGWLRTSISRAAEKKFVPLIRLDCAEDNDDEMDYYDHTYFWVKEIFPDYIIVSYRDNDGYKQKRIGYSWTAKNEITFDDLSEAMDVVAEDAVYVEPTVVKFFDSGEMITTAVRSVGEDKIGGYTILFGSEKQKDVHGNWFTSKTANMTAIFESIGMLPWIFQHGVDGTVKSTVIGVVDSMGVDEVGVWFTAKIREHEAYKKYVKPLIDAQKLFSSSGALPLAAKALRTGEIINWTIAEISGTHTPAEPRMLEEGIVSEKDGLIGGIGQVTNFDTSSNDESVDDKGAEKVRLAQVQLELESMFV